MQRIKLNHWFVSDNSLGISLMRFHVEISLINSYESMYYKLTVTTEDKTKIVVNFYSLEEAILFTEHTINQCLTKEEIIKAYQKQYKNVKSLKRKKD